MVRPESGFSGQIHETVAVARRKSPRSVRISVDDGKRSALFNSLLRKYGPTTQSQDLPEHHPILDVSDDPQRPIAGRGGVDVDIQQTLEPCYRGRAGSMVKGVATCSEE